MAWITATYADDVTPDDEDFLTELYQALHQEAVGPESPYYVALERLPGNVLGQDAVPRLGREIRRSTVGNAFFLSGLRGSGKSSQLKRLRRDLGEIGFAVLMADAENYLDLRRPLDVTQMLFFLVGAIWDEAVELARARYRHRRWMGPTQGLAEVAAQPDHANGTRGRWRGRHSRGRER